MATVKRHVGDLKTLLLGADHQQRKTVLQSFIERIEVDGGAVTVEYHLPETRTAGPNDPAVLSIVPIGRPTETRTPVFTLKG